MYPCVVCGRQQSVPYGNEIGRVFNQELENRFEGLVVTRGNNDSLWGMN